MGLFGALLGAEIEESREDWGIDTRSVPFLEDLDGAELAVNRNGVWWERYMDLIETYRRKCFGKLIFGEAAVACNLDYLAQIRPQVRVMTDFYDNSGGVHRVVQQLQRIRNEILEELRRLMGKLDRTVG